MGKKTMPTYANVDEYIANQPEKAQKILHELRAIIHEVAPEVIEHQDAKVPSFTLVEGVKPKLQLMMAAYNNYISFYPYEKAIDQYSEELKDYKTGRGTVKFGFTQPLPKKLIRELVRFRKDELSNQ